MTRHSDAARVVLASREIAASTERIFELIADPAQQPRWDGNENLAEAPTGQRVRAVGDMFIMRLAKGSFRENHVVEFDEGRLIAWNPAEPDQDPPGHLWVTCARADRLSANARHPHLRLDRTDQKKGAFHGLGRPLPRTFRLH